MKKNFWLSVLILNICLIMCACETKTMEPVTARINEQIHIADGISITYEEKDYFNVNTYFCKKGVIDKSVIENLFNEVPEETQDYTADGKERLLLSTNNNRENGFIFGSVARYCTEPGFYHDNFYNSLGNEISFYLSDSEFTWDDYYGINTEYSPEIKGEIQDAVYDLMLSLGINDYSMKINSVSQAAFEEYSDWYSLTLGNGAKDSEETPFGEYEEFYYINIYPLIDSIPVFSGELGDIEKGTRIAGTTIFVVFTKSGIESFYGLSNYVVTEIGDENINIISQSEAVERLKNKYENELINQSIEFNNLELVYLPYPNTDSDQNKSYVLTPAWRFSDGKQTEIYFNAITGEEVV